MDPPGRHVFYMGLYSENMKKIFLSETTRYESSSSGPQPSLFKLGSLGQKLSRPRGQMFYIRGLYRQNMENLLV